MTVGKKIRLIRKDRGLTQKKLGELCGINEANIRKYELGNQNPKLETLTKIAKALNVHVTDFISEEGVSLRKENAGLEGLKKILECVFEDVEFKWHKEVDCDGIPEYDGDYNVFIKTSKIYGQTKEIYLDKKSYEALFNSVCGTIPSFIKLLNERDE